jgi:hypothetical protein
MRLDRGSKIHQNPFLSGDFQLLTWGGMWVSDRVAE